MDIALIVTGLLAIAATFMLQSIIQRTISSKTIDYRVRVINDSIMLVPVSDSSRTTGLDMVHITLESAQAGWPLTTAMISLNPRVSWSLPGLGDQVERTIQPLTPMSQHLELTPEIRQALLSSSDPEIRRFSEGRHVQVDYIVFAIVTGVAWILLWILSLPILGLIGVGEGAAGQLGTQIRRSRRKQNRCEHCGYELKGLDFSAACPECGELLT